MSRRGRNGGPSIGSMILLVITIALIWSLVLEKPIWEWYR